MALRSSRKTGKKLRLSPFTRACLSTNVPMFFGKTLSKLWAMEYCHNIHGFEAPPFTQVLNEKKCYLVIIIYTMPLISKGMHCVVNTFDQTWGYSVSRRRKIFSNYFASCCVKFKSNFQFVLGLIMFWCY